MNTISETLAALKSSRKKALSFFLTAGYPTPDSTLPVIKALCDHGADLIELGVPFSDPVADGPVIQASSEAALRNGMTVNKVLDYCRSISGDLSVPIILMGYANPILSYGPARFMHDAHASGARGIILPDIPPEECGPFRTPALENKLPMIFLAAPTSDDDRLRLIDETSDGFVYCVSVTGVTGERKDIHALAASFLKRARKVVTRNPILAGFGISTPEDARLVSGDCDGVIVGSALIRLLGDNRSAPAEAAAKFASGFRTALDQ
jgi:tryptophan synthase alpha chain